MEGPIGRWSRLFEVIEAGDNPDLAWLSHYVALKAAGFSWTEAERKATRLLRDEMLFCLWRDHFPTLKPRPAAENIETEIKRYEVTPWPRVRHGLCPERPGTQRYKIWQLLALGASTPGWRTIFDIFSQFVQPAPNAFAQILSHNESQRNEAEL